MKKLNILAALVLVAGTAFSQTWTVDKAHAKLGFGVTHMLLSEVDGNFKTFDVTITSSKDDLSDAAFSLTAEVTSIDTDNENRDNDLKGEKYFDVAKFPQITFKSNSFKKVEGNKYKLGGDLTIKGITKPVELDIVLAGPVEHPRSKKKMIGIKASGTFKRTDFGVGGPGGAMLSEEILLIANGEFVKQ
jgi:polyisoprenoid-binding protein YceI